MQFGVVFRVLGVLMMIFSFSVLPPAFIALYFHDGAWLPFLFSFCLTLLTGFVVWHPFRYCNRDLKIRDGFVVVILFWSVLSLLGAIPFMIAEHPHQSFTDGVFESMSGLTTTGASILTDIDYLPHAIKFYRQELQFLGGMGIVVLAVAVLPMLGIGGLQLYRAEIPGPAKDTKLTPRIKETAKALWYIYVGLTVTCAFAYWVSGMHIFDAIGESFGTISTGGFSMHDASFGYYHNPFIEMVAVIFMILGSTNFSLHFLFLQHRGYAHYWRDQEFRLYIFLLLGSTVITAITLICYHTYSHPSIAISEAVFNAISLGTNTGFVSEPIQQWPTFLPLMLMISTMIGGCAASTSGGVKVIRLLLLCKQGFREIKRLIHPNAVLPIKIGNKRVPENIVEAVWGFLAIFVSLFVLFALVLMGMGLDFTTSFGALVACFANAGVGIGDVSTSFAGLNAVCKWVLIFAMLAGRLEIFTLLVIFTPAFWRR